MNEEGRMDICLVVISVALRSQRVLTVLNVENSLVLSVEIALYAIIVWMKTFF